MDYSAFLYLGAMVATLIGGMANLVVLLVPGGRRSRNLATGGVMLAAAVIVSMAAAGLERGSASGQVLGLMVYGLALAAQFLIVRTFWPSGGRMTLWLSLSYGLLVMIVAAIMLASTSLPLRSLTPSGFLLLCALTVMVRAFMIREKLIGGLFAVKSAVAAARLALLLVLPDTVKLIDFPVMQVSTALALVWVPTVASLWLRMRSAGRERQPVSAGP